MQLTQPISSAGGIYKRYSPLLEKLDIYVFQDFLYHLPHRYDDYSHTATIAEVLPETTVTVRGTVLSIKNAYTKFHRTRQTALVTDATGTINITWFNQPFLVRSIKVNDEMILAGRVEKFGNKLSMQSPDYEIVTAGQTEMIHTGRLVPIYPETKGISSKWLRRQVYSLLQNKDAISDLLPEDIKKNYDFLDLSSALQSAHFPTDYEIAAKARERLAFEELFQLQLQTLHRRHLWKENTKTQAFDVTTHQDKIKKLLASLPFQLTTAQQSALDTIFLDLQQENPMNRLLQGDVGSGKTIVAAVAMYLAVLNGKQAVLMAPTEILAEQHYTGIKKLLEPLGITIGLVTGSTKKLKTDIKQNTKYEIQNTSVLVGTHALLYDKANFANAGIIVIDEQQRFGVEQRGLMKEKGNNPHILTMTATPIPRTMALTVYGDLDVSYLDEMPVGRKQIKTWLVPPEKRDNAYLWIQEQILSTDSQAFIICPFIEESENMQTIKAAAVEFERLQKDVFPQLKLGLLHGRMKGKEKDQVLQDFRDKKFHILVATPVVEVGIDIPNATIIIIEASERFGLSQLHQLRGRVGRGDKQSYCLLFTESKNPQTVSRLKAMETTHSGAKLAELDLQLRGAGDIYGVLQSGYRLLKIASFADKDLIEKARNAARQVYRTIDQYPLLKEKLKEGEGKRISQD